MKQQRRLSKSLSRKKKGSHNRTDAAARLGRHHHRVADMRRHFLHQVSGELVKTHNRLVIENLNVAGMLANHHLARAVSDAGWSEFARMLRYKQAWHGRRLVEADRWYPSTRLYPQCKAVDTAMTVGDRVFSCGCGHTADRDTNAAEKKKKTCAAVGRAMTVPIPRYRIDAGKLWRLLIGRLGSSRTRFMRSPLGR
jgi:putative transposase